MRRLRKYVVFWILVLGAFAPFAASVGAWARSTLTPALAARAASESAGVATADEEMALLIESHFEMVDVVNIAHVGNDTGQMVFVIQMGINQPVSDVIYESILVEALQGLDSLKNGEENLYWVELLYGNWLVGRLECAAGPYDASALSSEFCEYNDIDPASYLGEMIRWPGRPADESSIAQ